MEKIVNIRLMNHIEANSLLSPYQYDFRKMRSAPDSLIRLSSDIAEALAERQQLVCVFFDMEKAYDTTWRYGILKAVYECGIRGHLAYFIVNFLRNRQFRVKVVNTYSSVHLQEEGVPQGSVLSCCLFALAINEITTCLPHGVKCSLYVDDFMIYAASRYLPAIERRLQIAINNITRWTTSHGFTISEEKTIAVNFNRKRNHTEPNLTIGGRMLLVRPTAKFLGLTFDEKFTWAPHIRNLKLATTKKLQILRSVSHQKWGADRVTMLRLYRALIRSKLDYGCMIYGTAKDGLLGSLDPVHNAALRLCTGAFRSSPVVSLYSDGGEIPLSERRMQLTLQFYSHIELLPTSPTYHCLHSNPLELSVRSTFASKVHSVLSMLNMTKFKITPVTIRDTPIWNQSTELKT